MESIATQVGMPLDEFNRLFDQEGPFELINGERIPKMLNIAGHGEASDTLRDAISDFAVKLQLGRAFREYTFVVSYTSNWVTGSCIPDVMYYTWDRLEAYKAANPDWKKKPYILVPDLVVEVISPTDNLGDLNDKIDLYLLDGVRLVWTVDLEREQVSIYTLIANQPFTKQQTNLKRGDILRGGEVIPGFEIPVATIFE